MLLKNFSKCEIWLPNRPFQCSRSLKFIGMSIANLLNGPRVRVRSEDEEPPPAADKKALLTQCLLSIFYFAERRCHLEPVRRLATLDESKHHRVLVVVDECAIREILAHQRLILLVQSSLSCKRTPEHRHRKSVQK